MWLVNVRIQFSGRDSKKSNSGSDASFTRTQASPLTWAAPHWHTDTFCWELVICTSRQSFELLLLEVLWMLCLCQIWEIKTGAGVCVYIYERVALFTEPCGVWPWRCLWVMRGRKGYIRSHSLSTHTHLDIILTLFLFPKSATHTHTCIHPTLNHQTASLTSKQNW